MPVCAARACLLEALQIRRRIRRSAATAVERTTRERSWPST
jgi:hypothetical protein